jgi:hypothetical protein
MPSGITRSAFSNFTPLLRMCLVTSFRCVEEDTDEGEQSFLYAFCLLILKVRMLKAYVVGLGGTGISGRKSAC